MPNSTSEQERVDPATATASDYDALPYRSMPYAHTQPTHLAAVATLLGIAPPAADRAHVIELGCASGGNLIPLAASCPDARFLGIDLSVRHVEAAQRTIGRLGLQNIEIRHSDIAELRLDGQPFDYLICHGVFSWVPKRAQDAIFRICAEHLAANGIAISATTRSQAGICAGSCATFATIMPATRARPSIASTGRAGCSSRCRRSRARRRRSAVSCARRPKLTAPLPNSYILGEFLAADNDPCYFHEFAARAASQGLTFLCEADLAASVPENIGAEQAKLIRTIAGSNPIALEQYMDFFTGRTFRRSLLVRVEQAASIQRALNPQRLRPLHLVSQLNRDATASTDDAATFRFERRSVTTNDPVLQRALAHLAQVYPASCSVDELFASLGLDQVRDRTNAEARLLSGLLRLAAADHLGISTMQLKTGRAAATNPVVPSLVRMQAADGQEWGTSLHHRAVGLHPALRVVLPLLDGQHDRVALRDQLVVATLNGKIKVAEIEGDGEPGRRSRTETAAARILDQMLRYLEQHALLAPES